MKNIKNPSSDLFSIKAYKEIIQNALDNDYIFMTVKEFWKNSQNILKKIDAINNVSRMNREFLRAGSKFEMPIKRVYQNVFQFGWGKNGFQLNGTFLEQIPWNATLLARSKIRS